MPRSVWLHLDGRGASRGAFRHDRLDILGPYVRNSGAKEQRICGDAPRRRGYPLSSEDRTPSIGLRTFTWKLGPKSGLDSFICAIFTRQRSGNLVAPILRDQALSRRKVDEFVPRTLLVNLRIVSMCGLVVLLSDAVYLLIIFRKSTPPQNRRLDILIIDFPQ